MEGMEIIRLTPEEQSGVHTGKISWTTVARRIEAEKREAESGNEDAS